MKQTAVNLMICLLVLLTSPNVKAQSVPPTLRTTVVVKKHRSCQQPPDLRIAYLTLGVRIENTGNVPIILMKGEPTVTYYKTTVDRADLGRREWTHNFVITSLLGQNPVPADRPDKRFIVIQPKGTYRVDTASTFVFLEVGQYFWAQAIAFPPWYWTPEVADTVRGVWAGLGSLWVKGLTTEPFRFGIPTKLPRCPESE